MKTTKQNRICADRLHKLQNKKKTIIKTYDKENKKPVIKASICNGEQGAGFKDIHRLRKKCFQS